tara:strand:- start:1828 stop:2127 length:300 start_codon:yes stop_codon:yes gene_type:complete
MYYADNECTYKESSEPEHTYTFTGHCRTTHDLVEVTVKGKDLFKLRSGRVKYIQDAFPYLSPDEREFLMTGFYTSPFQEEESQVGNELRIDVNKDELPF